MAVLTLLPNGTVSNDWTRQGGTTAHGVLADVDDNTWLSSSQVVAMTAEMHMADPQVFSNQRIKQWRWKVRGSASAFANLQVTTKVQSTTHDTQLPFTTIVTEPTSPWFTDFLTGPQSNFIAYLRAALVSKIFQPTFVIRRLAIEADVWDAYSGHSIPAIATVTDTDQPPVTVDLGAVNHGTPSSTLVELTLVRTGPNPDETVVTQTCTLNGAATGQQTFDPVGDAGLHLANGTDYQWKLRVGKPDVAGQPLWSTTATRTFTVSVTRSTPPALFVLVDQSAGSQHLNIDPAALTHSSIVQVETERSEDDGATWRPIRVSPTARSNTVAFVLDDYDASRDVAVKYRARTTEQLASGSTVTSDWTTAAAVVHPSDGRTWLLFPPNFDDVYADVDVNDGRRTRPQDRVGVYVVLGATVHTTLRDDRPTLPLQKQVVVDVTEDTHPGLDALLEQWQGTVLIKWPAGGQDYMTIVGRDRVDRSPLDGQHVEWTLDLVNVVDGHS